MAFILSTQTLKTQSINRKPNYDDIAEKFFENNILEIIYALAYVAISSSYQSPRVDDYFSTFSKSDAGCLQSGQI